MSEATVHWTIYEWRKHGVRKCQVLGDFGALYFRAVIDKAPLRVPKTQVFPTAHMALEAAHAARRRLAVQQLRFWRAFAQRQIEVTEVVETTEVAT